MATPRSHADPGINERRLRPIYDCLDNNNNKKALQEADKLLKKQKDFSCAKVLKALALIRLNREEEGSNVLSEVHADGHTEDSILQAMTICYRELHKPELIADAYEIAVRKEPQNEELISHLFMAYVRLLNYKKQHQTAMALYKLKPKNPYYFWAVMSLVMQACNSNSDLAEKVQLPLAQKMVEKFIKENKIDAEAEIQLYLMILEKQGKYEECLKVLEGNQQEKLNQYLDLLPRKKAELLMLLKRWPEANSVYKELLRGDPDNWSYYLKYFETVSLLVDSAWTPDVSNSPESCKADYNYPLVCAFIKELVEKQSELEKERRVIRGPFLARLELHHRLCQKDETQHLALELGSRTSLMVEYFMKYGSRMVCYTDLAHLISTHVWAQSDIEIFVEETKKMLAKEIESEDKLPENVKDMQQHLCLCLLQYSLGLYDNLAREQRLETVKELLRRYSAGREFGQNLLPTDFHPSDDYALIASSVLIDMWQESGEESLLCQVITLLEKTVSCSPSNFHMKLLLIKLYNCIGAVGPSHVLYESMDIKHIQQETMGYLTSSELVSVGHFNTALTLYGSTMGFYEGNLKDAVEYLIACYKFGSFTKVQEMVHFCERLNHSLYYASVTLERLVISLMQESKNCENPDFCSWFLDINPRQDDFSWKNLQDNKDVFIFRLWSDRKKNVMEQFKEKQFQEEIYWYKLWSLVLRCTAAAYHLSSDSPNQYNSSPTENNNNNNHNHQSALANGDDSPPPHEILLRLTKNLREHIASIDTKSLQTSMFPLHAPDPLRLKGYLEGGHSAILLSALDFVLHVHSLMQGAQEESSDSQLRTRIVDGFKAILQRIEELFQCHLTLIQMRSILHESVNFIQTVSIASVLFNITRNILKPVKNVAKRNKKRKETQVSVKPEMLRHFEEMVMSVSQVVEQFVQKLHSLKLLLLERYMEELSISDKECCSLIDVETKPFAEKVEQSYSQSIKEISELAQSKIKFLQGLKL